MIAQRVSSTVIPFLQGILVIVAGYLRALGLAINKFIVWVLTDVATVAGGGAIVWGVHFFGAPVPIGIPLAWITAGVLTILFVAVAVKPLR